MVSVNNKRSYAEIHFFFNIRLKHLKFQVSDNDFRMILITMQNGKLLGTLHKFDHLRSSSHASSGDDDLQILHIVLIKRDVCIKMLPG